jgi:hypothetical protein
MDAVLFLSWIAGAFVTFGMLLTKWGGLALILAPAWPAYWLAYLGYWLAN